MSEAIPWLAEVAALPLPAALTLLQERALATTATLHHLAESSLHESERDLAVATHWLELAAALAEQLGTAAPLDRATQATLAYAQARLQLFRGEIGAAEALLTQAQVAWQAAGEVASANRALLGLTQVLAMQGRYTEAETTARAAIAAWQALPPTTFAQAIQQSSAHHNLATLLSYTERHALALAEFAQARQRLEALAVTPLTAPQQATLTAELAHHDLNCATAYTFLDQPAAAEQALLAAAAGFAQLNDHVNQGRAQTNCGRLYLRTGRYHDALTSFAAAWTNLVPQAAEQGAPTVAQLRQADELLLEQAMAYLVVNLLPEAQQALAHCTALFQSAGQPYELGQTHYTAGLLALRTAALRQAEEHLQAALGLFTDLDNPFWQQRTRLALAALAQRQGQLAAAVQLLESLATVPTAADAPLTWDLAGRVEAGLLRLTIAIEQGEQATARQWATTVAGLIESPLTPEPTPQPLPHYALRLHHALGRLARLAGESDLARAHFETAITLLEATRATLSIEEVRTAFVEDKSALYADLVQLLLDLAGEQAGAVPQADSTTTADLLAAAFAVAERARSRTLLERLLAATGGALTTTPAQAAATTDPEAAPENTPENTPETAAVEALRQRLHWLYNQLLGESGSRRLDPQLSQELLAHEAMLQRLAWQQSDLWQQAQAVDLATFQARLAPDQQALLYLMVDDRLAAFLVDRQQISVYRGLAESEQIHQAMAELRFQLGRAEVGGDYLARHGLRLQARLRESLGRLYHLLIAPIRPALSAERLLIVPVGELHRLPFHALWDGAAHLLHHFEFTYAPSASVAALRTRQRYSHDDLATASPWRTWAGLAVDDPAIPAARQEVERAARHFAAAQLFVGAAGGRAGLIKAAQADVLHLATHGLFRPDNPFFSALKLADGWIDVRELYRLPLAARLVILSACESGVGGVRGGDEVVGLARGFLGAGSTELIATLWNVHDASAADLMDRFYTFLLAQVAVRPAVALRAAQRQADQAGLHPYYWAAFFVIGD